MTKVANPAIVIGLGGTGQWALTYLKKNLIDTYGELPKTVKLLAFDTTSERTEAKVVADKKTERRGEERAQVGNVRLEAGEFIYLGGNIRRICEEIKREGKHTHIGSWLQAEQYLQAYDDDAYEISKGAGQRRPFGRMAVFYDLATGTPQITGKINQAITDVMTANERQQPIEFYVVCSTAGGTGSGMFIDLGHIARKLAERAGVAFAVRGFVVLPNTFEPVIKVSNILPNAFAAMRELDRFMLVFDRDYPIYYSEERREPLSLYHSIYKSKVFDSCYLLDSVRPNLTLRGVPPNLGVFPAVAECITALLDPETGDTFAQHYKNVNNDIAQAQAATGKALYSSLGTYTYILPVEDIIERNTHRAVIQLLCDYLLKIEQDPVDGRLRVSSAGNTEAHHSPREEAMNSLKAEKSRAGLQNLHFSQQVALVLESGRLKEQDFIADIADMGIEMLNWILPTGQDDVISEVANSIQAICETSFVSEVPNSKVYKDGTPEAAGRIKTKIAQMREEMLGREDASGHRVEGELQKGLAVYQQRNVARFHRLLVEKLLDTLNGITDDPLVGKVGKLPYAQEFTGWLVQAFDEFGAFMRTVVKARADSGELAMAREDALATKQMMDDTRMLTGLLNRIRGMAVKAQDQHIAAETYLLELERQEILYQAVLALADAFKSVALEAKAQCDQWVNLLALGGPVEGDERNREIGTYSRLLQEQAGLQRRREEQARIKVYKYLSGPGSEPNPRDDYKYEDALYGRMMSEKWPDVLRRFSWVLTEVDGRLRLQFKYRDEELAAERSRQELATDINARFLLEKLRPYFYDVRSETVADRMHAIFTAQESAQELLNNSGPMIAYEAYEQEMAEKHNFVCVNRGVQVRYFDDLAEALRRKASEDKDNQVIGLTNKHRCIVVSTVDLLTSEETAPYRAARRTYEEFGGDRRLLHDFPAEVNASGFEQRLPQPPLYESVRLLAPDLVALLEDRKMVRRFIFSLVYDLVREEEVADASGQNQYVLRLDRLNRRDRTSVVRLTRPSAKPELLDAMTTFVYPRITTESGKREICDVTLGSAIRVEPSRVDTAVKVREGSIVSGREVVVEEFAQMLKGVGDILTPAGANVLPGAFRNFLAANERALRRSGRAFQTADADDSNVTPSLDPAIVQNLEIFLDDNDDCYEARYKDELQQKIITFLDKYAGDGKIVATSKRALARRFERFIGERPDEKNRRKGLIQRLKASENLLERDLAAIMHLVLWDEIERLESLSG
jgi:hypothetical protein